ncbi:elongation factor P [Candidatus Parcubacteria bacterium]|nr:MAG: elongation factor P [Candidatus Parcubacteria bacterium]
MLSTLNDIKVGLNIIHDSEPYTVLVAHFVRMQQRKPVMQTKLRNLITGKVLEITFKPGDRVEEADLSRTKANFLYADDTQGYFMDNENYEQFSLDKNLLGSKLNYLKEGTEVNILNFNDKPVNLDLPVKMNFKVISAPPGVKGNSAAGRVTKEVQIETGHSVQAPLFINEGDVIKINTDTGEYVERVNE